MFTFCFLFMFNFFFLFMFMFIFYFMFMFIFMLIFLSDCGTYYKVHFLLLKTLKEHFSRSQAFGGTLPLWLHLAVQLLL